MSLKAFIPSGQTALTVNGLHQWDYGQKLEIHDDTLPAQIEVHFACVGMTEATVRSCTVVQGVAEAAIPDHCLEQTAPITAYIYEIGESSGATTKAIVLTVSPRPRPQIAGTLTPTITDKYTELMAAVNEQVAALKAGNVTVARALTADKATEATKATTADKADEATKATTADKATKATTADKADEARLASYAGILVPDTLEGTEDSSDNDHIFISEPGIYVIDIFSDSEDDNYYTAVIIIPNISRTARSTIAKDIYRNVSCQVVYYPGRPTGEGGATNALQIEHDADYDYVYKIARCVRIANLY